jgi:hypothetical protein
MPVIWTGFFVFVVDFPQVNSATDPSAQYTSPDFQSGDPIFSL